MIEIVTALIGGACLLGGAVITARWTRSRSTGNRGPAPLPPSDDAQSDEGTSTPHPPRGGRQSGITVNGQFIETNHGNVSQNNYRDGKQ
jgi:hypothetical protein